jgi:hypothetical protein
VPSSIMFRTCRMFFQTKKYMFCACSNYIKPNLLNPVLLGVYLSITPKLHSYMHLESYVPLFLSCRFIEHEGLRRDEETLQPSIYLNKYVLSSISSCKLLFRFLGVVFY